MHCGALQNWSISLLGTQLRESFVIPQWLLVVYTIIPTGPDLPHP